MLSFIPRNDKSNYLTATGTIIIESTENLELGRKMTDTRFLLNSTYSEEIKKIELRRLLE